MDYPKRVIPVKEKSESIKDNNTDKKSTDDMIEDKSEILIQEDLREIFKV